MSKTIAVTGATGQLGRAILEALIELKLEPIGIARTPSKADLNCEIRAGDYDNQAGLEAAFKGIDSVVLVSGNTAPSVRIGQHQRVIDAAKAAGVSRVVYTGILIGQSGGGFNEIQQMSKATEDYLKASGLKWSVGRNGLYIEPDLAYLGNYVKAKKIWNCAGEGRCAYTYRPELAAAYAQMVTNEKHDGQIYNLGGEPVTQEQLAEAMNTVFGTDLGYEPISVDEYRAEQTEALGDFMGAIIAGIYQGIREGAFDVQSNFEQVTGRNHQSLEEMIRAFKARPTPGH